MDCPDGSRSKGAAGAAGGRCVMKKRSSHRHTHTHGRPESIVGCRIQHGWREAGSGPRSCWTGMVLARVSVRPALLLIKYDGVDCVCGLELFSDPRVLDLQVRPGDIASFRVGDSRLAERLLGRPVVHWFQTEDGSRDEWKGLVLARAPSMPNWFFITYEKDPMLYMYQLMQDYRDGDLRILPESDEAVVEPGEVSDSLVGKQVECVSAEGTPRTGTIIQQVQAKPSVYFIKFDDDYHIYVYDMLAS